LMPWHCWCRRYFISTPDMFREEFLIAI
jgi:hypothetical protein